MTGARFVVVASDPVLASRVGEVLRESGRAVEVVRTTREVSPSPEPAMVVVELDLDGAIDAVGDWKVRWPAAFLVGALRTPRPDLWHAARAAGCHLVANSGSLPRQLRRRLAEGARALEVRRLRVLLNDRPGDGLAGALPDAPDGEIAVFRAGGCLYAILDRCPHAAASLSGGDFDGAVVTCPEHGSQFDVTTGARVRGPSDFPVRTYPVVEESGRVYVELT